MAWTKPLYPREQVNAAAKIVLSVYEDGHKWGPVEWDEYEIALAVVNNWRASHGYPLNTFQVNLRNTGRAFDEDVLVAQRIKRLVSIESKLVRFPMMKLTQMQDLGGCRGIFATVGSVQQVVRYYEKKSSIKHELASKDDYITTPKKSGYRGVHLVYRYVSDKAKQMYNGLKIEMQLRSRYQHAWATAVETVGMFSGQALKSSIGSEVWQRFFSLMGTVIAIRERRPIVPDTHRDRGELLLELSTLVNELNVRARLTEYGNALKNIEESGGESNFYLLQLDPAKGQLLIDGFETAADAQARYSEAEENVRKNPGTDAVLVSAGSISALQRAYPNYFADTRVFVALLEQAFQARTRKIVVPPLAMEPEA